MKPVRMFGCSLLLLSLVNIGVAQGNSPGFSCSTEFAALGFQESKKREQPPNREMDLESLVNKIKAYGRSASLEKDIVKKAEREMASRSAALKAALAARPDDPSVNTWDTVSIGGGVHNSILTANLPKESKKLTVEASGKLVNTFRGAGPTFTINSPELEGQTANQFPGGVIALKDLSTKKFVRSDELADLFSLNYYATNGEPMLGTKAASIEDLSMNSAKAPARFKISFDDKKAVYSERVFIATGLGEQSFGLKDPKALKFIQAERSVSLGDPRSVPGIQHFDDAMANAARSVEKQISFNEPYQGQTVAVVGSGDGANVFVEGLLGKAPKEAYPGNKDALPSSILWLGQKAKNAEEYRAINKARYHSTLAEQVEKNPILKSYPDRLVELSKTVSSEGKIQYRLVVERKISENATERTVLTADKVVFATGYKNNSNGLLEKLPEHILVDVKGPISPDGRSSVLAKEVQYMDGTRPGIFIYGPSAGEIANPAELEKSITHNPVSINVLADHSAALGRLFQAPPIPKEPFCVRDLCTLQKP